MALITPFWDTVLSNTNFDEIPDFENLNLCIKHVDDHIEIYFKLTYSTNVFIYEENYQKYYKSDNNKYWLSLNPENLYKLFDKDKIQRHVKFYKKLLLYRNKYEFVDEQHDIYTVPFWKQEGIDLMNNWIQKYKNIISGVDRKKLIIELSSGIDTRILTYFWRNTPGEYYVYTKNDPKELDDALRVIHHIEENFPVKLTVKTNKAELGVVDQITLNGGNIDFGFWMPTDPYYFADIIGNPLCYRKAEHIAKNLCPYYDKDYLRLLGIYPGQMKVTLLKYLCDEKGLNQLPIKTLDYKEILFTENIQDFLDLDYFKGRLIF